MGIEPRAAPWERRRPSEDGRHLELLVCPLERLDLDDPVVHLVGRVPQLLAVRLLKLLHRVHAVGLEDVDGDVWVARLDAVQQLVRLLEVVQGVEEDELDGLGLWVLVLDLGEHVHGGEPGEPKRR